MFDLAAVAEHFGEAYIISAVRECGKDRCEAALKVAEKWDRDSCAAIISQLMFRDRNMHLIREAQMITQRLLAEALEPVAEAGNDKAGEI